MRWITMPADDQRSIVFNLTKKQIEDSPSLDFDKPVSRGFEQASFRHYGYPMVF